MSAQLWQPSLISPAFAFRLRSQTAVLVELARFWRRGSRANRAVRLVPRLVVHLGVDVCCIVGAHSVASEKLAHTLSQAFLARGLEQSLVHLLDARRVDLLLWLRRVRAHLPEHRRRRRRTMGLDLLRGLERRTRIRPTITEVSRTLISRPLRLIDLLNVLPPLVLESLHTPGSEPAKLFESRQHRFVLLAHRCHAEVAELQPSVGPLLDAKLPLYARKNSQWDIWLAKK